MSNRDGNYHVTPCAHGGWAVKRDGNTKATQMFESRLETIRFASTVALRHGSDLYVHNLDGTVAWIEMCSGVLG